MMRKHTSDIPKRGKLWRGLNTLAAVLVAALLVGGLVAVVRLRHQTSVGAGRITEVTPTPTTPSLPIGTTVYTTPPDSHGYSAFSWSPDSTRIASLDSQGVQFWDATTGKHLINFHIPGQNEWAWGLSWSPNGQDVAVGTTQEILLVNAQTGQVVRSLSSGSLTSIVPGSSGSPYLASELPASGGFGYRSLAWSPDGRSIAAAISFGPSGAVQLWNAQAGTLTSTFSLSGSYVPGFVSWSSDGKYLAMHAYNSQPTDLNAYPPKDDLVTVWSAATHQVIFHQINSMSGSDAGVFWQPKTDNLAFMAINSSGRMVLQIWNASNGTLVKQYPSGIWADSLAWSPDGQEFAYQGMLGTGKNAVSAVIIADVSSGQQIYAYKAPVTGVFVEGSGQVLAWSPNGKYIVSTQVSSSASKNDQMTQPEPPEVAKVWVA